MIEIRKTGKHVEKTLDLNDILRHKVVASDGSEVGFIYSIRIDAKSLTVLGIIANKGLFASDYYIGMEYIDKINEDGVVLKIIPSEYFKGKEIIDSDGKNIGKVKGVNPVGATYNMFEIVIDNGVGKEDSIIHEDLIQEIGENIILRKRAA